MLLSYKNVEHGCMIKSKKTLFILHADFRKKNRIFAVARTKFHQQNERERVPSHSTNTRSLKQHTNVDASIRCFNNSTQCFSIWQSVSLFWKGREGQMCSQKSPIICNTCRVLHRCCNTEKVLQNVGMMGTRWMAYRRWKRVGWGPFARIRGGKQLPNEKSWEGEKGCSTMTCIHKPHPAFWNGKIKAHSKPLTF